MNRIIANIRYKLGYQLPWLMWYLIIYLILMMLIFTVLIKTSLIHSGEGSLVYRLGVAVIWQFAIAIRFREDYNFFLTLSNTRHDIFLSLVGNMLILSTFFSGLIVLEKVVVDYLNQVLGLHQIIDPFHFFSPYAADHPLWLFVFFIAAGLCFSVFGLLLGSLFYRFGKTFTLVFWLVFSSIPVLLLPVLVWPGYFSISLKPVGDLLEGFNVLAGSGVLFILALIFSTASYINIRKLPQR